MESSGSEVSHCLALWSRIASSVIPLYFTLSMVAHETEYRGVVVVSQPSVQNYSLELKVYVTDFMTVEGNGNSSNSISGSFG